MRAFLALTLCLAAGADAQSGLVVSPDTLRYPDRFRLTVANPTSAAVPIDSVATVYLTYAWSLVVEPENAPSLVFYLSGYRYSEFGEATGVGLTVPEGGSVSFDLTAFDPCTACRRGGGLDPDTLLIFSDGRAEPDTVVIDLSLYVSAEATPAERPPFEVSAYPNPSPGQVLVAVEADRPREIALTVFDALGREVVGSVRAISNGSRIPLDLSDVPPGIYTVRVDGGEAGAVEGRVVIVR